MHPQSRSFFLASLLLGPLGLACGGDGGGAADGGYACVDPECLDPEPADFACPDVVDGTGRSADVSFLSSLRDPLAVLVLKQPWLCPRDYSEVLDKLRLEERTNCDEGGRVGLVSHVISERGFTLQEPDVARGVVFRECGTRAPYSLAFHLRGLETADPREPPSDVDVIALDSRTSAFNFYSLRDGTWTFHGTSLDIARDGPDHVGGCGACHTAGGLVMRELQRPWVHWHGAKNIPGTIELVDRFEDLGRLAPAVNLETLVRRGNRRWNLTRAAASIDPQRHDLHVGSLEMFLSPLFCASRVEVGSAGDLPLAGGQPIIEHLAADFFVDPLLRVAQGVPFSEMGYREAAAAVGTRLEGILGATDTYFPWTYVRRSDGDVEYVELLLEAGLFDEEFVLDVLSVEMSRPAFSPDRCALLDYAPAFADLGGPVSPERLRVTMIVALTAADPAPGTAAADLLANLQTPGQAQAHRERAQGFVRSCAARAAEDEAGFLRDAFEVAALRRRRARDFSPVLDTVGAIADDDLQPSDDVRFDPATCTVAVQ